MLTVAGIAAIIGSVTVIAWTSYYPIFALDTAAQQLASDINMTAYQAISTQNNWLMVFIYRFGAQDDIAPITIPGARYTNFTDDSAQFRFWKDSYLIINDDGWTGTPPRTYWPLSPNFVQERRNNGQFGINELVRGPVKLSRGEIGLRWTFTGGDLNEVVSPKLLVFEPDGGLLAKRDVVQATIGLIWIADFQYKMGISESDPTYDDMIKHRRFIRVRPRAKVETGYGPGRVL